jgi:hypothetical protein
MTSGALAAAYLELAPQFECATGHHMVTEATSIGTGETLGSPDGCSNKISEGGLTKTARVVAC